MRDTYYVSRAIHDPLSWIYPLLFIVAGAVLAEALAALYPAYASVFRFSAGLAAGMNVATPGLIKEVPRLPTDTP